MFRLMTSRVSPIARSRFARCYFLDRNDTEKRILECVKNFQKVNPDKVNPTAHFINDLGLDSLDQVEVVMAFEQEFLIDIPDNEAEKILTIDQATEYIANHPHAK